MSLFIVAAIGIALILFVLIRCMPVSTSSSSPNSVVDETEEYEALLKTDAIDKNQRAAEAVNQFLNDSHSDPRAALLFKNNTNCNIIIRISGNGKNYRVPVAKMNVNYLVLDKSYYTFKANLCRAKYSSSKQLTESLEINLSER